METYDIPRDLKDIPSLEISNPGSLMFTCNLCYPKIVFTDIEGHALHYAEIHGQSVSYKNIMVRHCGFEESKKLGISAMSEIQVVDLIVRFNRQMAKRK